MDISAWLRALGLEQYAQAFRDNAVNADVLPDLTADDLKDIGVCAVGDRRRLLCAIHGLKTAGTAQARGQFKPMAEAPEPEGERRQVTVLFADLSGYTRMSRELDVEEVHAVLDSFFACTDRIVDEHGGRVDKHIGDCVMAVFGAPVAHGNDAERALRAALSLRDAMAGLSTQLGRSMRVHIGVASGQVVASGTGSAGHRAYTVTGDTVNLASRLTDAAEADEILVSELVRRALADRLDCEKKELMTVKGFAEPVPAWQLRGLGAGGPEGRRFVGRFGELQQFRALLAACQQNGRGQGVSLRGDAGIGKTRLLEAFRSDAREEGFVCHTGVVLDFGAGMGRDAVGMLVRDLLGLEGVGEIGDTQAAAAKTVDDGLVAADDTVFLNDLLDLPQSQRQRAIYDAMDNQTRYRGKCRTLTRLVERAAWAQPRLLAIEDVHWADDLTLGYMAELTATVSDCPAVLVMTTRLDGDPFDRAWRAGTGGAPLLTLDLAPLRPEEARTLAAASVGATGGTDQGLADRCVERAAGNPLFLQQLLLHARETAEIGVPGSVQNLVQGRLDRLAPGDKAAIQAASVLGQRFDLGVLAHILQRADYDPQPLLTNLLVRPQGEDFLFAHALIRDAIYDTLLKVRRRALHERAAQWFADRDPLLQAEHLERAGHPGAARAYLGAARAQSDQYRYETARRLVERGLALSSERGDRFALACLKGDILHDLGDMTSALEAYQVAQATASDEQESCQAWIGLAGVKRITEDLEGAFSDLAQAETAAVSQQLTGHRARIHFLRGNLCFPRGDIEGCLREHGKSLDLARQAGDGELEAAALGGLADGEYLRGRMLSAYERLRACIEVCRHHGFGRIEVANHAQVAHTQLFFSPQQDALDVAWAAADAAFGVSHHRAELNARVAATYALMALLDLAGVRNEAARVGALVEHLGARRFDQARVLCLGRLSLQEGRHQEAVDYLEQAVDIAGQTGVGFHGPTILGTLALAVRDPEKSRQALVEGENVIAAGCAGHNQLRFYPDAMQVALNLGDHDSVERYARALIQFTRAEPLPWADFFVARGRTLAAFAQGDHGSKTVTELQRLRDEGTRLGLKIALPDIRTALAEVGGD